MNSEYKNIAISGESGTGTSTLARNLAEKLSFKYTNAGEFFREWHNANHIPLENTGEVPEWLDRQIDEGFQRSMQESSGTVFESRLAGWLARDIPGVYRILCVSEQDEALMRIATRDNISLQEAQQKSKLRATAMERKFFKLYGAKDFLEPKHFNLVVNTSKLDEAEALQFVLDHINS